MSNLFGGLFEANLKMRQDRAKAAKAKVKEEAKREAAEEAKKKQKEQQMQERANAKRKKEETEDSDDEMAEDEPAKKKQKISESASKDASSKTKKTDSSSSKKASKNSAADYSSDGFSDPSDVESDRSVMEFGSDDDDASPALIAQLQDMISSGHFPDEVNDADKPKKAKKQKKEAEEEEVSDKLQAVFVGNLMPSVTRTDLIAFIESVATPVNCRVLMQNRGGRSTAVAFMDFQKASEAKAIVATFNNKNFKGKPLQVRLANDRKLAPAPAIGESVYVRNLAFTTTEETLTKLFAPCGEIIQIRLPIFEDTGKHRGYGFVDYKDKGGAKKALSLNRKEVDGRQILVEPALKREAPKAESFKSEWCGESLTFDD